MSLQVHILYRYAAVLVKRDGPEWEHTTGSLNSLKDEIAGYRNKGYAPTIISIAGFGNNATYAVVWEKGAFAEGWMVSPFEPGSNQDFFAQCKWAQENGYYLVSATVYGSDTSNPQYAAIWARYSNTQPIQWFIHVTDDEYQSKRWHSGGYRPSYLAVTSLAPPDYSTTDTPLSEVHRRYLSVFRNDSVGRYWTEHSLSEEQYGPVLDENKNKGFYPTCIQGSVIGQDTRYAVIFGQNDRPRSYDRKWTVTGQDNTSLAGIDEVIKNFMQHDGIRAGVLAIKGKDGDIKLFHGYTWAEHDIGYPITQPNSLFRIASVSKMFTCAAIQKLYDDKLLYPDTKVFPKLEISSPAIEGQKPDDGINNIEVQHLVAHRGGWIRGKQLSDQEIQLPFGEPVFGIRNIARRLKLQKPLTKMDFARYMYGQKLQFTPGIQPIDVDTYSNFGYVLLGMLVEKVMTPMSFTDFVREKVLAPINVTDVFLARTSYSLRADNEVFYDDPELGPSAVDQPGAGGWYADTNEFVPYPYGGAGFSTEIMDSGGGLMSTAEALVQFASRYPVDCIGKERLPRHSQRNGAMPGTTSLVVSRGDGVDYAYIFNRWDARSIPGPGRVDLTQKIDEFLHNKKI